eukprot:3666749-Alexandrium_andersonii.AAC.1
MPFNVAPLFARGLSSPSRRGQAAASTTASSQCAATRPTSTERLSTAELKRQTLTDYSSASC